MKIFQLSVLSMAVLALAGCKEEAPKGGFQPPPKAVSFITVKEEPVKIQSELKGRLAAVKEAEVRPQISGIIQSIKVEDGQPVKKGDVLYKVDSAQYQAAHNQAVAAYESIQADIKTAKLKADRYEKLSKDKAISTQEADDAKANYEKLQATLAERQAAVEIAKINLAYTDIKAPIDGVMGISTITPGALVTANQANSINTITTLNPIYLDIAQPSQEFQEMMLLSKELKSTEIPVELTLNNSAKTTLSGVVSSNEIKIDPQTDSIRVRALFKNDDKLLLPGMFAYATITYGVKEKGIKLPAQSIQKTPDGKLIVLVVDETNKIKSVDVDVLQSSGKESIISSGLKDGDKVVFEGTEKVRPGDEVVATEYK